MQQRFHVTWSIDIDAETAKEAAEQAWACMQAPGSTANYFEVYDQDGVSTNVDLSEE